MDVSPFSPKSNSISMMANSATSVRSFTDPASSLPPQLAPQLTTQLSPPPTPNSPAPLAFTLAQPPDQPPDQPLAQSSPQLADIPLSAQSQSPVASEELREAFEDFVGQTFFAEMIKACRSGQQPSAYFHGGRAEEIFQGQLDQVLSEELSESSASKIADPMFELFMLKRQS